MTPRRANTRRSAHVTTVALALVFLHGPAAGFDMQSCPMDKLTFVDPWTRTEFPVARVGTDFYYACGDDNEISHDDADATNCRGPYGDIMLEGSVLKGEQEKRLVAVYSIHLNTAPCCGWAVYDAGRPDLEKRVAWLEKGNSPSLREWPFASIHNSWGDKSDLDGFAALKCAATPD
jgi:hypothetical protein